VKRGAKLILTLTVLLIALGATAQYWLPYMGYVQLWYYQATFTSKKAEHLLAEAGWTGPGVEKLIAHTGHPVVWMDGVEKFKVQLSGPFFPPPRQPLPAPDKYERIRAKGQWYRGIDEDGLVQRGIAIAKDCADTDMFQTTAMEIDSDDSRLFFSLLGFDQQRTDGFALIYNTFDDTLVYAYCNY
jgi:hypothetical protein